MDIGLGCLLPGGNRQKPWEVWPGSRQALEFSATESRVGLERAHDPQAASSDSLERQTRAHFGTGGKVRSAADP